jgi:hypothetical protein
MSCLSKHNYFDEIGGFGTRLYRNNHLSEILREDHPESVKDAVGFMYPLYQFLFYYNATLKQIVTELTRALRQQVICSKPPNFFQLKNYRL